jgi:hypothetical protein
MFPFRETARTCRGHPGQETFTEGEGTVPFASLYSLANFCITFIIAFVTKKWLDEEVNCTEPSLSVGVPCLGRYNTRAQRYRKFNCRNLCLKKYRVFLGKPFEPCLTFVSKAAHYPSKKLSGDPLQCRLLDLPTNIKQGLKGLLWTDALAYHVHL